MYSAALFALGLLAGSLPYARAEEEPSHDQFCLISCYTSFSYAVFAGEPDGLVDYYGDLCQKEIHVASIYACSRYYCTEEETTAGLRYYESTCTEYGMMSVLPLSIVDNYTDADIQALPRISFGDTDIVNQTSIPDEALFDLAVRTIDDWFGVREKHLMYSKAMFMFWGIVLFIGIVHNTFSRLNLLPSSPSSRKLWARINGSLIQSPTFSKRCAEPVAGSWIVPPRLESFVIFLFLAINVILCAAGYVAFPNNLYFADPKEQTWRYLADRTGYLSYANLSIFWLFGIRNNILLWATGWEYPTFNRFHRWVAAISTVEAIIHSVAYTVESYMNGGYASFQEDWTEEYWYTGEIATIAMSVMLGFSLLWFRVRWYDLFLVLHIGFALVVLVNLFYHTKIFLGEYDGFLWPCVAFWGFDRAVRIGRFMLNYFSAESSKAEFVYEAGIIRVELRQALSKLNKRFGGSNYYIYVPSASKLRFWESHPFTLVHWQTTLNPNGSDNSSGTSSPTNTTPSPTLSESKTPRSTSHPLPTPTGSSSSSDQYTLMVRPHNGMTRSLKSSLLNASSPSPRRTILLEGPYGHAPSLTTYPSILLVIGGSGISVAISSIYAVLRARGSCRPTSSSTKPGGAEGASGSGLSIRLVWAVRDAALLRSVASRELKAAIIEGGVQVDAYVTRQDVGEVEAEVARTDSVAVAPEVTGAAAAKGHGDMGDVEGDRERVEGCAVRKVGERPDVPGIVAREVRAGGPTGRLVVVACGPKGMMDDARLAVVREMRLGRDVAFKAESFEW